MGNKDFLCYWGFVQRTRVWDGCRRTLLLTILVEGSISLQKLAYVCLPAFWKGKRSLGLEDAPRRFPAADPTQPPMLRDGQLRGLSHTCPIWGLEEK